MNGSVLLVRSGRRLCALPVEHVEETMRPQPCEPFAGVPAFVRGASVIRGAATPIVDLRVLLGDDDSTAAARLVTLKTGGASRVGLLVDEVLGVREGASFAAETIPPLLADAAGETVADLTRLDEQLVTVLRCGRLVSSEVHERLAERGAPP